MAFQHPAPKMPISSFLLLFISLPRLTAAASLIQPTTTQNSSNPLVAPVCVHNNDWLGTRYSHHDCQQAVQQFISDEVDAHDEREFEFLAPHAEPIHTLPTMLTPRRYTGGACSLVIAMLSSSVFARGRIPELPPDLYYPADVSNYREIAVAAQNIVNGCVKDARSPQQCGGWINVGGRDSIGIFIWGTFSMMNRRVGLSVNVGGR
ncbi:hypothetical protein ABVK25_008450 [Lepraria finkii]|uniref:Uncharacterized protein n=1 Tax=Lepraria finkii TaxID=1340010 RepID=A0ABR4B607_9LECA